MNLSTRIRISYAIVFLLPVLLIIAVVASMTNFGLNTLKKNYDLDYTGYEMFMDPMQMMGRMTSTTIRELNEVIEKDSDKLLDKAYLENINEQLASYSSYIVVNKNGNNIFSGLPNGYDPYEIFNEIDFSKGVDGNVNIYTIEDSPYHVRRISFTYHDGQEGRILIYTNVEHVLPQVRKILKQTVIMSVLILFFGSLLSMLWLHQSIVRPLGKLKQAAENIKDGNLNFNVSAETDDEIGELCTAFEEMRIKLKSQIEQNIQYEKESKELMSNISHDLKTPMTAIKGYIEGLMDGVADTEEKRDKYIKTIYNKVNDMNSLIEELFLYAKLDCHSVTYAFVKLNLDDYFQDCVEEMSLDLDAQGIEFGYFNYADKKTVVIADPEQLKRVIHNIIGNSVKYASKDRKPIINIRILEEAEFVKIEIEDNGKGIAKKELPFIFDRCYRTDASRNSSTGGSGLGLSIAKKIIEEHGGKIWALSTENVGTTMCFVLRKYKENENYE